MQYLRIFGATLAILSIVLGWASILVGAFATFAAALLGLLAGALLWLIGRLAHRDVRRELMNLPNETSALVAEADRIVSDVRKTNFAPLVFIFTDCLDCFYFLRVTP